MRVLIGGTRFIGPRVVRRLVKIGHEVGVFYGGEHEMLLPVDVRRFKDQRAAMPVTEIPEELRAFGPEIALHMIAMEERDAEAARKGFLGIARRIVAPSSGDVYRAFGIFKGCEDGPVEQGVIVYLRRSSYSINIAQVAGGSQRPAASSVRRDEHRASHANHPKQRR